MSAAAVAAVLALHERVTGHYGNRPDLAVCAHCTSGGDPYCYPEGCDVWPCATVAAIRRAMNGGDDE